MELVEGETLADIIRRGPAGLRERDFEGLPVLRGFAFAVRGRREWRKSLEKVAHNGLAGRG
jgi:hypothetical protein